MRSPAPIGALFRKNTNGDLTLAMTERLAYAAGDAQFFDEPVPLGTCALRPVLASELPAKASGYPRGTMLLVCRALDGFEYRAYVQMPPLRRTNLASNIALAIKKAVRFDRALGATFAAVHSGNSL